MGPVMPDNNMELCIYITLRTCYCYCPSLLIFSFFWYNICSYFPFLCGLMFWICLSCFRYYYLFCVTYLMPSGFFSFFFLIYRWFDCLLFVLVVSWFFTWIWNFGSASAVRGCFSGLCEVDVTKLLYICIMI